VDSIMALRLKAALEAELGVEIPIVSLIGDLTLDGIAKALEERLGAGRTAAGGAADETPPIPLARPARELAAMNDEQLQALVSGMSDAQIDSMIGSLHKERPL
jgi:hypothetical protein